MRVRYASRAPEGLTPLIQKQSRKRWGGVSISIHTLDTTDHHCIGQKHVTRRHYIEHHATNSIDILGIFKPLWQIAHSNLLTERKAHDLCVCIVILSHRLVEEIISMNAFFVHIMQFIQGFNITCKCTLT
jgi:hypothetical protein